MISCWESVSSLSRRVISCQGGKLPWCKRRLSYQASILSCHCKVLSSQDRFLPCQDGELIVTVEFCLITLGFYLVTMNFSIIKVVSLFFKVVSSLSQLSSLLSRWGSLIAMGLPLDTMESSLVIEAVARVVRLRTSVVKETIFIVSSDFRELTSK